MKKKVLFVIDSLNCGGAEKSLIALFHKLDYSSLDVYLSIVRPGGVLEEFIPSQVQIIPFPKPNRLLLFFANGLFSLHRRFFVLFGIKRHGAELGWNYKRFVYPVFNGGFDVAIAYQQGFPTYYIAEKMKAAKKVAWINVDLKKAGYRSGFNHPYYKKINCVCVVSDALSEMLSQQRYVNKEQVCVIKDIVDTDLIRKLSLLPIQIGYSTNDVVRLLTVGRMVFQKNYPLAVETARLLAEKNLPFQWIFVGEGDACSEVENLIEKYGLQEKIFLAGLQTNPYPFFAASDIYVSTSLFEGFGLTLSEAKILHKPVVTTNFPSAFDQIQDGKNGLIAEMSPESLAEKILLLVSNPVLRKAIIRETEKEQNKTAETESQKVNALLKD